MWWVEAFQKHPGSALAAEWPFPELDADLVAEVFGDAEPTNGMLPLTPEHWKHFGDALPVPADLDFQQFNYYLEYRSDWTAGLRVR
jgi:hypothetical protein